MKLKNMMIATSAALALSYGATSQATGSFSGCVATALVNFDGTVVDAALATPELSTLVDAVVAAGLVDALNEAENITVFAPTNDAFDAVPTGILEAVLGDAGLLTTVLTYHVTPTRQDPRRWITARGANTLAGPRVFFHRKDGHARVNQAGVACEGVRTDNGIVWLIDSVLLP